MLEQLLPEVDWEKVLEATKETIYMTSLSVVATFIIGIILGLLLFLTAKGNIWESKYVNSLVAGIVNVFRSIPFITWC
jgi:D-methionine transport system permease protein